jgi:hypothetical protein
MVTFGWNIMCISGTMIPQKTPSWNSDQKFEIFENLKCVMYSCLFKTLMIVYLDTNVAVLFSDLFKCKFCLHCCYGTKLKW